MDSVLKIGQAYGKGVFNSSESKLIFEHCDIIKEYLLKSLTEIAMKLPQEEKNKLIATIPKNIK